MTTHDTDDTRRRYWSKQMEAAYAFMETILDYPVAECGEPFASLRAAVADAGVEVAFSDAPLPDGLSRQFHLRQGLIGNFVAAARAMNERGWLMKVEDGFRSRAMQSALGSRDDLVRALVKSVLRECGGKAPPVVFIMRRMAAVVARCPKVGTHMSGSAIDISVLSREDGREIDRGGPYLTLTEITPMGSPFIDAQARRNRAEITALMGRHGFVTYPWEFWHYNAGDAFEAHLLQTGRPARYGPVDWDSEANVVTPIRDARAPLVPPEAFARKVEETLRAQSASGAG